MTLTSLQEQFKQHFLAGSPALYIQSAEEARVDQLLSAIASSLGLRAREWNLGYGWVEFNTKQPVLASLEGNTSLAACLPALQDQVLDGKLYVIKNAGLALQNDQLALVRLKQLLNRIQRHHAGRCAVVLVSQALAIPAEIESQVTLLPLPLPDRSEILLLLRDFASERHWVLEEALAERIAAACRGLSEAEIGQTLRKTASQRDGIDESVLDLILREKEQVITKGGVLEMIRVRETIDDIGGLDNLKQWLQRRGAILSRLSAAEEFGIKPPKGVLIAGMPGCGKSLSAKVAASLFQMPLLRLDIGSLLGKYVGESEHNMRRALQLAEAMSPCVLWLDELEKAFVGLGGSNASEVTSRLLGYFLTWMQEKTGAVFVIATANDISAIPPELMRKGRFDEIFYVGFPDAVERKAILQIHLQKAHQKPGLFQLDNLSALCRDYSGADIESAVNEALQSAFIEHKPLGYAHLTEAIQATVPLRETLREKVGIYEALFEQLRLKPASLISDMSVAQMIKKADSPNLIDREEVAKNANCPDDLLEKLAHDKELSVKRAVYCNPRCPENVLSQRLGIAANEKDYDSGMYEHACLHPNASGKLLLRHMQEKRLSQGQVSRLLELQHCPAEIVDAVLHQSVDETASPYASALYGVRLKRGGLFSFSETEEELPPPAPSLLEPALRHRNASAQALAAYAQARRPEIRILVAANPSLGDEQQETLSRDSNHLVRAALARNLSLGASLQERLRQDEHPLVREAMGISDEQRDQDRVAPAQAGFQDWDTIEHGTVKARSKLAASPACALSLMEMLLLDPDTNVLASLAGNPALPPHLQEKLPLTSHRVTAALAANPSLSRVLLSQLVEHCDQQIGVILAARPDLRVGDQQQLRQKGEDVCVALAANPVLLLQLQGRLADAASPAIRRSLASNPFLKAEIQLQLAGESNHADNDGIRAQLAANPGLIAELRDRYLNGWPDIQIALAHNPALLQEQCEQLEQQGTEGILIALAANPAINEAMQLRLADKGTKVSLQLAMRSELALALQRKLSQHHHTETRLALSRHPMLAPAVRTSLLATFRLSDMDKLESKLTSQRLSNSSEHERKETERMIHELQSLFDLQKSRSPD